MIPSPRPGSWTSLDMDPLPIVAPGPSWRVAPGQWRSKRPEPQRRGVVDAAGPAAALGRAHGARPQVLGNRCAVPTSIHSATANDHTIRLAGGENKIDTGYPATRSGRV